MRTQDSCRVERFEDPADHAREFAGFDQQYCQTGPGRFAGTLHVFPEAGGVRICREQLNVPMMQRGALCVGGHIFGVPLDAARVGTFQGMAVSDTLAHLRGGDGFEVHSSGACDHVLVSVDDDAFAGYAEYLGGLDTLDWVRGNMLTVGHDALVRVSAEVGACVEAAGQDTTRFRFPNARKALCDDVMGILLCLLVDAAPAPRRDVTHLTYADVVQRSREYVLAHPDDAVSVLDLCRLLRISRRTLQTSFIEVSGVPPSVYLRAVRLAAVRKLLRETPASALSIGDAAARWGFLHASKFAADFRKMFGVPPSHVPRAPISA